jgi:hypothetical protein
MWFSEQHKPIKKGNEFTSLTIVKSNIDYQVGNSVMSKPIVVWRSVF